MGESMDKLFHEVLSEKRRERGMSQTKLVKALAMRGLVTSQKSISAWETGNSCPNAQMFLAICEVLKIDDILWAFTGTHQGPFAGLNEEGRKKARDYITLLMRHESPLYRDEPEQEKNVRLLPLHTVRVSAGTGNYLDESDFEMIEVPDGVPDSADYALRIGGDSMEPVYHDGQIVWVKAQQTLNDGDVGVFYYDAEAYLKQLTLDDDGAYLRSFNPRYKDIEINDNLEFRIMGKVVAG